MPRLNSSPRDQLSLTSSLRAQIDVGYNDFDQASSLEFIAAMKGKSMVSIGMARCKLGVEGAKAVAEMASVMASLTKILVGRNKLEEEGTKVICEALKGDETLKELDLSGHADSWGSIISNIGGPAGAKHVADMLSANASLTKLDAEYNRLGKEGRAVLPVLRKAVEGRSGFELKL